MSWLDDAKKFVQEKEKQASLNASAPNAFDREEEIKRLKMLYDNATQREIEKALDAAFEQLENPLDEKERNAFLKRRLED